MDALFCVGTGVLAASTFALYWDILKRGGMSGHGSAPPSISLWLATIDAALLQQTHRSYESPFEKAQEQAARRLCQTNVARCVSGC